MTPVRVKVTVSAHEKFATMYGFVPVHETTCAVLRYDGENKFEVLNLIYVTYVGGSDESREAGAIGTTGSKSDDVPGVRGDEPVASGSDNNDPVGQLSTDVEGRSDGLRHKVKSKGRGK